MPLCVSPGNRNTQLFTPPPVSTFLSKMMTLHRSIRSDKEHIPSHETTSVQVGNPHSLSPPSKWKSNGSSNVPTFAFNVGSDWMEHCIVDGISGAVPTFNAAIISPCNTEMGRPLVEQCSEVAYSHRWIMIHMSCPDFFITWALNNVITGPTFKSHGCFNGKQNHLFSSFLSIFN